jgi:RNA polymerase sigma factor (sigma-70 family)
MRRAAGTTAESSSTAVGLLYERYSRRILAYCLHALRDRSEAEDAVQTTFLHAHRALRRGVTPEHEFAWLHTIAKNVCRMQQRTAARRAVVTGVDLDAYPAVGDAADEKELRRALGDALASLPEAQRRALVMREWQGLSSSEVASRMGMSTPATYALLTRARRSLVHALTTVKGRSALGVNVWPLLARLKALFAGGAAKVATATAIGVAVAAGGATTERALADRLNGPSVDTQSVPGSETATPVFARAVHTSDSMTSATRGAGDARDGAGAPSPGGGVTAYVPEQPDAADAPTPALPPTESEVPTEPTAAAETPSPVEDELEAALEAVPELPLPEVGVDIPGVSEVVPDEPLPPFADSGLPEPPVEVPPVPALPPLP